MSDSVKDIWHVGFVVEDIERAIVFYRDGLGMTLRHRQEQANEYTAKLVGYPAVHLLVAQMELPGGSNGKSGHTIELIQYVRPPGEPCEPENRRISTGHLAFEVDDLEAVRERVARYGATFLSETLDITAGINQGGKVVYFRDEDGITLEFVQPRKE